MVAVLALAALAAAAVAQQSSVRRYTSPDLPPRAALDRLSLTLAWSNRLPTRGTEDGLFSLQLLPANGREELLVQTRLGTVFLLDPATGDIVWRTHVGGAFQRLLPVGYNDEDLFVIRDHTLFVLDRRTGRQRMYTVDPRDGHVTYGFDLKTGLTAPVVGDRDRVYLCQDERIGAYNVPRFSVTEAPALGSSAPAPPPAYGGSLRPKGPPAPGGSPEAKGPPPPAASTHQPSWAWGALTSGIPLGVPLPYAPVVVGETVNVIGAEGSLISVNAVTAKERYRYKLYGAVAAPMGELGGTLYIGCEDHRVYAIDAESRALHWRFQAHAPVVRQPWVTKRDVFATAKDLGMFRVDRESGEPVWLNKRAVQFLAANQKLVYAVDGPGRLLVLDYARGTTLADYDLSEYTVRFSNERTDRIFLGAHDGTLLCLHHRDNREPFHTRDAARPPAPKKEKVAEKEPPPEKKEEPKKAPEKEKEKEEEAKKPAPKEELKKDDLKKKEDLKKDDMKKKEDLKKDKDKAKDEKAGQARPAQVLPTAVCRAAAPEEGPRCPPVVTGFATACETPRRLRRPWKTRTATRGAPS
jgi:outer membrane protein assembly factor BamB